MDEIVDIDEVLSESFYTQTEEAAVDIENILQQWKESYNDPVENKGEKYVDTRTFTRPKKKMTASVPKFSDTPNKLPSTLNLQIGGLVTSLQRSYLGNTSPPSSISSMDLSIDHNMENSLITSSDFANVSYFMNNGCDSQYSPSLNEFNPRTMNQRTFLDHMSNTSECSLIGEINFAKFDLNKKSNAESDSNTILNINDSYKLNSTFDADCELSNRHDKYSTANSREDIVYNIGNTTFDKRNSISKSVNNRTLPAHSNQLLNKTYNNIIANKPNATYSSIINKTINCSNEETISNRTFKSNFSLSNSVGTPTELQDKLIKQKTIDLHSTPIRITCQNICRRINNISPIVNEPIENLKTLSKTISIDNKELEDLNDLQMPETPISPSYSDCIEDLQENERQSLNNFEAFEKSMSLLENDQNEKEFEAMINNLGNNKNSKNDDKMRQSLDHIKKRHSLLNLEKQQEKLKEKENATGEWISDSNKLNYLGDNAMMSSSGSGERLLRRSRLYDNISPLSSTNDIQTEVTHEMNKLDATKPVNKTLETIDISIPTEEPTDYANSDKRGRFKTMRIIKKPIENTAIPPIENICHELNPVKITTPERFIKQNTNSPNIQVNNNKLETDKCHVQPTSNYATVAKTQKMRPSYLSGLSKRDFPIKSTSVGSLDNKYSDVQYQGQPKAIAKQLKTPIRTKSNSIHNLLDNSSATSKSSIKYGQPTLKLNRTEQIKQNDFNFKKPVLQQPQPNAIRRSGLVRPSSGYYSYNVKRNDSDTESSKFSSANSLSSSGSSLYKQDVDIVGNINKPIKGDQLEIEKAPIPCSSIAVKTSSSKPSGLRAPSNIGKRSCLPRPMSMLYK